MSLDHELLTSREMYWEQVKWAAAELFGLEDSITNEMKSAVCNSAPEIERSTFHENPLRVAADLADVSEPSSECVSEFDEYWSNPNNLFTSSFEKRAASARDNLSMSSDLELLIESNILIEDFFAITPKSSFEIANIDHVASHALGIDGAMSQIQTMISLDGEHSYSQLKKFSLSLLQLFLNAAKNQNIRMILQLRGVSVVIEDEESAMQAVRFLNSELDI